MDPRAIHPPAHEQGFLAAWNPGPPELKNFPVRVVGLASTGVPVLGLSYVVELLRPIEGYPYTHAVAFDCHLTRQ